jgi:hypothetical protein
MPCLFPPIASGLIARGSIGRVGGEIRVETLGASRKCVNIEEIVDESPQ